jgi:hypothetical protein
MSQLREARANNFQLQKRVVVEEYLETARAWSRVAADILNHGKVGSNRGNKALATTTSKKASGDHAKASSSSIVQGKGIGWGGGKVSFEVLKEFVRAGDQLPCDRPEMAELKQEMKKGKSWLTRFNRAGLNGKNDDAAASSSSGSGGGGVCVGSSLVEVQALVAEAKDLCIDVSAELDAAAQATRKYCLCRQPYHGHMVS